MSHVALRRVMIRLLHDPTFVDACYGDVEAALAGVDVDDAERAWLLATPRAAWATDPERPLRVLAGLRDEYPVGVGATHRRLEAFFSSAAFHRAVQDGGSLAAAFAEWLQEDATPAIAVACRIEAAIARARRAPRRPPPTAAGRRRLVPSAVVVIAPPGGLRAFERMRRGEAPTPLGDGREHLLALRDAASDAVTVEELPDALGALLLAAVGPTDRAALVASAAALGADDPDAVVADLEADGLLI